MPYFELQKEDSRFPPAHFADGEGLLAVGGSISARQLVKACSEGIFYWHHPMKHIRWWSPDPRIVGDPDLLAEAGEGGAGFDFAVDQDPEGLLRFFQDVYNQKEQMGPQWLSERMFRIFMELHGQGLGMALEARQDGQRVGGFFGICLGEICHGEYTAATVDGADSAAISEAARVLSGRGVRLMDMHKPTARDDRLPYEELSRVAYVDRCKVNAARVSESYKLSSS